MYESALISRENMLLVTDKVSTADREFTSLQVIAHEFAHLWFGDLVTLKWWNTIWQQEGMAAFLESYILDKVGGLHVMMANTAVSENPPLASPLGF